MPDQSTRITFDTTAKQWTMILNSDRASSTLYMNTPPSHQPSLKDLQSQAEYTLGDTTIIGRHEDCNLVLKSERGASRKHARITIENGAAILMDLGSLNGTTVNGREISRAVQLIDGDVIVFDENQYLFQAPVNAQSGQSNNVTVIANKDEIGRPERIKPVIRVVDTAASAAQTNAAQSIAADIDQPTPQHANANASISSARQNHAMYNKDMASEQVANMPASNDQIAEPIRQNETPVQPEAYEPSEHRNGHQNGHQNGEQNPYTGDTAIPATSRPGGDAPTPARLQKRQEYHAEQSAYDRSRSKSKRWLWYVLIPLAILLILGALYSVYQAGFSAANSSASVSEPND